MLSERQRFYRMDFASCDSGRGSFAFFVEVDMATHRNAFGETVQSCIRPMPILARDSSDDGSAERRFAADRHDE